MVLKDLVDFYSLSFVSISVVCFPSSHSSAAIKFIGIRSSIRRSIFSYRNTYSIFKVLEAVCKTIKMFFWSLTDDCVSVNDLVHSITKYIRGFKIVQYFFMTVSVAFHIILLNIKCILIYET